MKLKDERCHHFETITTNTQALPQQQTTIKRDNRLAIQAEITVYLTNLPTLVIHCIQVQSDGLPLPLTQSHSQLQAATIITRQEWQI